MAKGSNHFDALAIDDLELMEAIDEFVSPDKSKAEIESWEVKRFVEAHLHQEPDHPLVQTEIIRAEELLQKLLSVTNNNEKQSEFQTDLIITTLNHIEPSLSLVEKILDRAKSELNMEDGV
jgi:hypothetical protein|tara:strand:+ start:806 stop:1168 length:363 start_codon:yes stop_codon:yes gene_type:complete